MKIQHLTFLGVRGIADASFDLTNAETGAPHDVVVVSGPPGSGKTRVLEAIIAAKEAIGPYAPVQPGASWIHPEGSVAKVAMTFHLDEEEQTYAGVSTAAIEAETVFQPEQPRGEADEGLAAVLERYDHRNGYGKLEYFATTRRIPALAPFHGLGADEQRSLRSGKDPRKYSFIGRFVRDLPAGVGRAFGERLAALSPTCRYEPALGAGPGLPRCFRSRGGSPVTIAELSDSESDAVIFAATATAIQLVRSLVLIDRPELYVHPADLPRFIAGLRALGQDNQLILASSSPAVLAAAGPAHVIELA